MDNKTPEGITETMESKINRKLDELIKKVDKFYDYVYFKDHPDQLKEYEKRDAEFCASISSAFGKSGENS